MQYKINAMITQLSALYSLDNPSFALVFNKQKNIFNMQENGATIGR